MGSVSVLALNMPAFAKSSLDDRSAVSDLYQACETLKQCLSILERHGPDSFDYAILANDFYQFGSPAKRALFSKLKSDPSTALKALQVLSQRSFGLTASERSEVMRLWPETSPQDIARVFNANLSPVFTQAVVRTLNHPSAEVQALSRDVLSNANARGSVFPLSQTDIQILQTALRDNPHPAVVSRLLSVPNLDVFETFSPVLHSGNTPSVLAAYEVLNAQDPKQAFQSLVKSVFALSDTDTGTDTDTDTDAGKNANKGTAAALSLSALIQSLHIKRPDGFYPKFAGEIASDNRISVVGRLSGLDAFIRLTGGKRILAPQREAVFFETFKEALNGGRPIDTGYIDFALTMAVAGSEDFREAWVSTLSSYFKKTQAAGTGAENAHFIRRFRDLELTASPQIVLEALQDRSDYRVQIAAIEVSGAWDANKAMLVSLSQTHPLTAVRLAAKRALGQRLPKNMKAAHMRENDKSTYCRSTITDLEDRASGMPYFDSPEFSDGRQAFRSNLKSAAALKNGWLAAYKSDRAAGGVYYFDYETGTSQTVLETPTDAILPIRKLPLGQYETEFWAVTRGAKESAQTLHRVSSHSPSFKTQQVYTFPEPITTFARLPGNSWLLSFTPQGAQDKQAYNPPLKLSASGDLSRACETVSTRGRAKGVHP